MKPIPSPISKEALDLMNKAQFMIKRIDTIEKKLEMVEHEGKQVPAFAADGKGEKDLKEKGEGHEQKIISCLKKKGGAASLEECAKECGVSKAECKKIIDKMDNVKMSPHGDVILTDGLQKGSKKCPECGEGMNKMGCMKMGCKMYGGKMEKAEPNYKVSYNTSPQENMFVVESGGQTRSAYYTTNQHLLDSQDVANKGASSFSVDFKTLASQMNPHEGGGADRLDVEGKISKSNNSPY
tara:strand:- start:950 stop:1666 length:717 start_codon:yes stop_codon:yes gene_type:complete